MSPDPQPEMPEPTPPAEALYEQREWLRVTLASIGDAVITTDTDGRVTFLNSVAQAITGCSQEDAAGAPLEGVFRIINEDTRAPVENPVTKVLRDGVIVGLANHTLLLSRDGTERPIDDSAAAIRNAKGVIAGVVLVFRDVTERRHQERSVQEALVYAESIVATVHEALIVLDEDLRVKSANRAYYHTFRVIPAETERKPFFELGEGQWDTPELRAFLGRVFTEDRVIRDFEIVREFPIVGRRTMCLNARRVQNEEAPTNLILVAIEDITERKEAETQIRDSELRYRGLFESARDGIVIVDPQTGLIVDANPIITEMLRYEPGQLIGQELWQIGLFPDRETNSRALRQLEAAGFLHLGELRLRDRTGEHLDVECIHNIYQVNGRPVVQCNVRDITERIQLGRTKVHAEALADLHRRKDEFLAMLSHELRNPLAPILNAVHLLRLSQESESPIQEQARTIIERQVGQLAHLIDDLLEVARITTGRIRLHKNHVDMRNIVDRAAQAAQPVIAERKHELTVTQPSEPVWLHADATRIEQIVVNLLLNAAQYTEVSGRIRLTVDVEGTEAVLRVRDSGVGIASDLLPRIFELFTQSERSLDRAQGGLGIGLSVVQKLTTMHGGAVDAYSALGHGSEFVVRLPIAVPPGGEQPTASPLAASPSRQLKVLVVDDNVDQADSLSLLLRTAGHDVRTVYAGPAVLDAALTFRPTIVILDIGLPDLDGYEVARQIRRNPELDEVRLIALTGYGRDADRRQSLAAGFDYHLVKPIDPEELQNVLTMAARGPSPV